MESELINSSHTHVLLLQQLFIQVKTINCLFVWIALSLSLLCLFISALHKSLSLSGAYQLFSHIPVLLLQKIFKQADSVWMSVYLSLFSGQLFSHTHVLFFSSSSNRQEQLALSLRLFVCSSLFSLEYWVTLINLKKKCIQAEKWHLNLDTDLSELENR